MEMVNIDRTAPFLQFEKRRDSGSVLLEQWSVLARYQLLMPLLYLLLLSAVGADFIS